MFQLYFPVAIRLPFDPRLEPIFETYPFLEVSNGPFVGKSIVWVFLTLSLLSLGVLFIRKKIVRIISYSNGGIAIVLLSIYQILHNSYLRNSIDSDVLFTIFYWLFYLLSTIGLWTILALHSKSKTDQDKIKEVKKKNNLFILLGLCFSLLYCFVSSLLNQVSFSWQFTSWVFLLVCAGVFSYFSKNNLANQNESPNNQTIKKTSSKSTSYGKFTSLFFIIFGAFLLLQSLYYRELTIAQNLIVPLFPRYLFIGALISVGILVLVIIFTTMKKKKRETDPIPLMNILLSKFSVIFMAIFLLVLYAILRIWNISSGFYLDWETNFVEKQPIFLLGYLGILPFTYGLLLFGKTFQNTNRFSVKNGISLFFWLIALRLVNWIMPILLFTAGYFRGLMFFLDMIFALWVIGFIVKSLRNYEAFKRIWEKIREKGIDNIRKTPISKKAIIGISVCFVLIILPAATSLGVLTNMSSYNPMIPREVEWGDTLYDPLDIPSSPPEWAVAEYNALQAYKEWVYYWLDNYDQRTDHTFSGVFEDDIELTRTWSLLPFVSSDQRVNQTLFDFAETAWNSLYMMDGVWNRAPGGSDVEHIAEPTGYLMPHMMLLDYYNETWIQRAYENAIHFGMDWTGINSEGHRHFRSYYPNAYDHYLDGFHDCDIPENSLALKPTLYAAWRDHSPTLFQWLQEYALAWVDHSDPIENIKPPGFFPSEIHYETDIEGYYSGNWYSNVNNYFSSSWNDKLYDALLMIYALTEDSRILAPIEQMVTFLMLNQTINNIPTTKMSVKNGAMDWSDTVRNTNLEVIATLWKKMTGNSSLDPYFYNWGQTMVDNLIDSNKSLGRFNRNSLEWEPRPLKFNDNLYSRTLGPVPYLSWISSGDLTNKTLLIKGCENIVEHIRENYESLTINALDRSYITPIPYTDHTSATVHPGGILLSFMTTGGIGSIEGRYPYLPVSYENSSYNITPLVLEENSTHVKLLLYNFENTSRNIGLKFWQLEDGSYNLIAGHDSDEDDIIDGSSINQTKSFNVNGEPVVVDINLPSQNLTVVTITNNTSTSNHVYTSEFEPTGLQYMHNAQRISVNNKKYNSQSGPNDVRSWAYATQTHTYIYLKSYFSGQNVNVKVKINAILPELLSYQSFTGATETQLLGDAKKELSKIHQVTVTDDLAVIVCPLPLTIEQIHKLEISVLSTHHTTELWISGFMMALISVFVIYVIQLKLPFSKWKDIFKSKISKLTNMVKKPRKLSKKKIAVISSALFLVLIVTGIGIYVALNGWSVPSKLPESAINEISDFSKGTLLYNVSLNDSSDVSDWVMEGGATVTEFSGDGWMEMYSPNEEFHNVFWCDKVFPDSFYAEWQVRNIETDAGLCIVFFAATGLDGESIFDSSLPERDGTYKQYTRGKINNYAISYYANANGDGRENANLRKNKGFNLVQKGRQGIPIESIAVHNITLIKDSAQIIMFIDGREVINWIDQGKIRGEPFQEGFIGFRQMKWTRFQYANFSVSELA